MWVSGSQVIFSRSDMHFVKKHGIIAAGEIAADRVKKFGVVPVFDTYQLSELLGLSRKTLFRLAKRASKYYREVTVPKKNGGVRHLQVPDPLLKSVQRAIHREILSKLPVSPYATAYKAGAKLIFNANPHVGKKYLLKLDLSDFFGSISFEQVFCALSPELFSPQVRAMLAELCCKDDFLVQGAPTSPALSNLVMKPFDDMLGCWCEKRGISYTRYSDDMTFSSDEPLFHLYEKVKGLISESGFELNRKKTKFFTSASRHSVTGIVVNDKPSVGREEKRRLRAEVHACLRFGACSAAKRCGDPRFADDPYRYLQHLLGRVNFLLSIEPDARYFKEAEERLWQKLAVYL